MSTTIPDNNNRVETGVIHGRFQVLHHDHLKYLLAGKARCNHLIVGLTNPDPTLSRTEHVDPQRSDPAANPLNYFERYTLVRRVLLDAAVTESEFSIVPFPVNFPELYRWYVPLDAVFFLTIYDDWGRRKKEMFESLGLRIEVLWERPISQKGLSSTEIRRLMAAKEPWEHLVPTGAVQLLHNWNIPNRLQALTQDD